MVLHADCEEAGEGSRPDPLQGFGYECIHLEPLEEFYVEARVHVYGHVWLCLRASSTVKRDTTKVHTEREGSE